MIYHKYASGCLLHFFPETKEESARMRVSLTFEKLLSFLNLMMINSHHCWALLYYFKNISNLNLRTHIPFQSAFLVFELCNCAILFLGHFDNVPSDYILVLDVHICTLIAKFWTLWSRLHCVLFCVNTIYFAASTTEPEVYVLQYKLA